MSVCVCACGYLGMNECKRSGLYISTQCLYVLCVLGSGKEGLQKSLPFPIPAPNPQVLLSFGS